MQKIQNFINSFVKKYLSTSRQVTRIILYAVIALLLGIGSFAGYYYFDRYYSNQTTVQQDQLAAAEKAVRDDPTNPDKRLTLAETYMVYLRWDDAIKLAFEVQTTNPDNINVDFILGISYANSGRPSEALAPLQKYIESQKGGEMLGLNTRYQAALYFLGDSYLQLGKPKDAIPPLEQDVDLSQTDADAMYKLGLAYNGVGEFQKAVEILYKASTFVPDFAEVYQAMIVSYQGLKQPELEKFAQGMLAYSQKDYTAALPLLKEAAAARPDFTPAFVGLGQTYEALKDLQNAKASYEAALKLDPNNFSASNNLQRVEALLKQ